MIGEILGELIGFGFSYSSYSFIWFSICEGFALLLSLMVLLVPLLIVCFIVNKFVGR